MQNITAITQTGEGSTGAITIGGAATITGATILTGAQTFTGAATFSTTLSAAGTMTAAAINASGLVSGVKATFSSTLGVSGAATMAAINASGLISGVAAVLSSTLTVGSTLTATGPIACDTTTDSTSTTTGSIQTDGGIGVAKAVFTGGALTVNIAALTAGDAYSGIKSNVSCTSPNNAYGAAGYFESAYVGTGAGHFYNSGSWINFGAAAVTGGYIVAAQDNGIYGTATMTNTAVIFGLRSEAIITGTPMAFCPFSLNTNNKAITALFHIASAPAIGYVMGSPSTSTVPCGTVPIFCDADGSDVRYVHIYDTIA